MNQGMDQLNQALQKAPVNDNGHQTQAVKPGHHVRQIPRAPLQPINPPDFDYEKH